MNIVAMCHNHSVLMITVQEVIKWPVHVVSLESSTNVPGI